MSSRVLEWPAPAEVERAVREWAERLAAVEPGVLGVGYFGSFARGDSGVGSDVDLVVVAADDAAKARIQLADRVGLPVPSDLVVFTDGEWRAMQAEAGRFAQTLARETKWIVGGGPRADA
ncbi:MAG: nucleotidyltransferase domain-containing protein [Burkholderiales bacterium]|nr:nucleotidyltransferase domain-containing protein [Burkholderiales bacterium]